MSDDPVRDSLERLGDNWRQMHERSGPIYDAVKAKSPAMHEAWVAAGSPPRVMNWAGPDPMLYAPWKREKRIAPATPEQAAAWRAWVEIRARLRSSQP